MWRGRVRYRSRYASGCPKYAAASRVTVSYAAGTSSADSTTRSPFPPPPYAALLETGQPVVSPKATMSSGDVTGSRVPGTASTAAAAAAFRDEILSPIISIASGREPIHVTPASLISRATPVFPAQRHELAR